MKTIDVNFKEWFDKANGNSYCAGIVTIDYGTKKAVTISCPFEYGYGDYYLQKAMEVLTVGKHIKNAEKHTSLWRHCENKGIILRHNIQRGCKKAELKQY